MRFKVGDQVTIISDKANGALVWEGDVGIIVDRSLYPYHRHDSDSYAVRFNKVVYGYFTRDIALMEGKYLKETYTDIDLYEDAALLDSQSDGNEDAS